MRSRLGFALVFMFLLCAMGYVMFEPHGVHKETKIILIRQESGVWRVWRSVWEKRRGTAPEHDTCRAFRSHAAALRYADRLSEHRYGAHVIETSCSNGGR